MILWLPEGWLAPRLVRWLVLEGLNSNSARFALLGGDFTHERDFLNHDSISNCFRVPNSTMSLLNFGSTKSLVFPLHKQHPRPKRLVTLA